MIIEMLSNLIIRVMDLMMFFEIPKLPPEVLGYIETAFQYIEAGAGIVANYVPLPYFMTLFGLLLAVDAAIVIYHFVMWILRKIPMAGVS